MQIAIAVLLVSALTIAPCAALELHVAPGGDDAGPGTARRPFATLTRARDAVREAKADGLPEGGITVWLHGGRYELAERLELGPEDSGSENAPILWRAQPGKPVVLSGGRRIPTRAFGPVTDASVLGRLPEEARGHVVQADLRALGVEEFGSPAGGGLEVFFGEDRLTLARWPNQGFTRIEALLDIKPTDVRGRKGDAVGKWVFEGDRPLRWIGEKDLWVHGYWFHDWADQRHRVQRIDRDDRTIEVEEPYHHYGYRKGQWYYAYNALAELDEPGEWYLDREDGVLYLWPPRKLARTPVTVSVLDELVSAPDTAWLTFEGLTFEAARGTAVTIGGSHNSVIGCTFRDIGAFAAKASGTGHRIMHCDAYALGEGGFAISGGDRPTLTPGSNVVENCHIHDLGEWKRMYVPGVRVAGVGNRVAHNLIHDAPHQAIGFSGNDHVIELNEMHSVCYESNDAGAIYAGRDWTTRGTVIRNNYMHHVNGREGRGVVGVYLDDMWCGTEISGNVFYRVIRAAFVGGGRDNLILNNVFAECPRAIHIDARALGWAAGSVPTTMTTRLKAMPFESALWAARYPRLPGILEDEPAAPKGNIAARNIVVGPYPWNDVAGNAAPYQDVEEPLVIAERGAFDPDRPSLTLPDGVSPPEGFEPIPMDQIGLYEDEARQEWPVRHEVRPSVAYYWQTVQEASLKPEEPPQPRPELVAQRRAAEPTIDGRLAQGEWPAGQALVVREGIEGEPTEPPTTAWVQHDGTNLLVSLDNRVDPSQPLRPGDAWGSDDAVEIALRAPAGPILVLRGFPSGHFESTGEAGAPPSAVERAAQGVEYAAAIVDAGRWTCEWRIPLASLGIAADPNVALDFNLSVRKTTGELWQMLHGTGAHTWDVHRAAVLRLAR